MTTALETKKPKSNFGRWIETKARELRAKGEAKDFTRLDPFVLAERMKIHVRCLTAFGDNLGSVIEAVMKDHGQCWDAGTLPFPDGKKLIVLNPGRTDPLRRNSSLMEELAHIHLNHKASQFIEIAGIVLRTCNNSVETQAYSVGAAALIPEFVLKGAKTRGYSRAQLAELHQVSEELVVYREKVTGVKLSEV